VGNVKFGQRDPEFLGGPYIYNVEKLPKKLWYFLYHGMGVGAGWVNVLLKEGYFILQR
jgi:hypothetical protein